MTNYQLYQHYKTQEYYRIINEIHSEETGEVFVSYQCVNKQNDKIWFQPKERFFGLTDDGKKRFTPFIPGDIHNKKLLNCISDKLIEEFDQIENSDEFEDVLRPIDINEIYHAIFGVTYGIKRLLGTPTTIQEDIKKRKQKGYNTYGCYLVAFNGRNALLDAYEEILDLLKYLLQKIEEINLEKRKEKDEQLIQRRLSSLDRATN